MIEINMSELREKYRYLLAMDRKRERVRAENFSKEEESLLLSIVKRHRDIINNRKTDVKTSMMKNREWLRIQEEFNSQHIGPVRSAVKLRTKYENLKKFLRNKLKYARMRLEMKKSGQEEEEVSFEDEESQILEVIGPEAKDFQNTYEDNNDVARDDHISESLYTDIEEKSDNQNGTESYIIVKTHHLASEVDESLEIPASTNLVDLSPFVEPPGSKDYPSIGQATEQPRTSKGSSSTRFLQTTRKTPKKDRPIDQISAWAASKTAISEQECAFKKELHEQKMRHLEEEHALRKKLLNQQLRHADEKQSWLREEHLKKMKQIT